MGGCACPDTAAAWARGLSGPHRQGDTHTQTRGREEASRGGGGAEQRPWGSSVTVAKGTGWEVGTEATGGHRDRGSLAVSFYLTAKALARDQADKVGTRPASHPERPRPLAGTHRAQESGTLREGVGVTLARRGSSACGKRRPEEDILLTEAGLAPAPAPHPTHLRGGPFQPRGRG